MTIKIPKPNFGDRFLASIGKRRAVRIPFEVYEKLGSYVYGKGEKESFWRALIRTKHQDPPEGWVYLDQIIPGGNSDGR